MPGRFGRRWAIAATELGIFFGGSVEIGVWDVVLVLAVSVQGTIVAYLHKPKWKALLLGVPVPFTIASLALGHDVDATHVTGLLVRLLCLHAVRWLYVGARVPIVAAVALSGVGYCVAGGLLADVMPRTDWMFWTGAGVAFAVALVLRAWMGERAEPGHRTPLPIWVKLPIIVFVVVVIVIIKKVLHGFMTVFPTVTLVAAYEARHSLWTVSRQIPRFLLGLVPMMATVYLLQRSIGLGAALGVGWVVHLAIVVPLLYSEWIAEKRSVAARGTTT